MPHSDFHLQRKASMSLKIQNIQKSGVIGGKMEPLVKDGMLLKSVFLEVMCGFPQEAHYIIMISYEIKRCGSRNSISTWYRINDPNKMTF